FRERPPKTAGREEFGRDFTDRFLRSLTHHSKSATAGAPLARGRDAIATATALTARSIRDAIRRFVLPKGEFSEIIASGGGTRNPTLMSWLANEIHELAITVRLPH